jgi:hypothetical protein
MLPRTKPSSMTRRWLRGTWTRAKAFDLALVGSSTMPVKNPGKILEEELLARPAHLRPGLLELAERHAKEKGDFEMARAVKQYRDKSRE